MKTRQRSFGDLICSTCEELQQVLVGDFPIVHTRRSCGGLPDSRCESGEVVILGHHNRSVGLSDTSERIVRRPVALGSSLV